MEELLPRSKDRFFFFLNTLVLLIVCHLPVRFPVTILVPFNKKFLAEWCACCFFIFF